MNEQIDDIKRQLGAFVASGHAAQEAVDHVVLMHELRRNLHRWRSRYAKSEHARQHVKETSLLIDRIDEWLLKQ